MKKEITYDLKEDMAQAIRKVLQNIRLCDFTKKYNLTNTQMDLINEFFSSVDLEDEKDVI